MLKVIFADVLNNPQMKKTIEYMAAGCNPKYNALLRDEMKREEAYYRLRHLLMVLRSTDNMEPYRGMTAERLEYEYQRVLHEENSKIKSHNPEELYKLLCEPSK